MSRADFAYGGPLVGAARGVLCLLGVAGAGCRLPAPGAKAPLTLVEKGSAQTVYDSDGRLLRILIDTDGDRRADMQILHRPEGTPRVAEMDTDRDGVVDRWERFAPDGSLESVGRSLRTRGRPDAWDYPDGTGRLERSELDDDGDGSVDRVVRPGPESTLVEELDTNGDGRADRRLLRDAAGVVTGILIDSEGDGTWECHVDVKRPRRP